MMLAWNAPRSRWIPTWPGHSGNGRTTVAGPFKDVVNEAIRSGLSAGRSPGRRPYRLKAHHLGGVRPGIDLDKALQLAAALDDAETARKLELRK